MANFKCKICGGSLEIDSAQSVATCEYCGTRQTLPKLDDERRANLYDRANHFRRNNDFDKAMGIYENILDEDNTDSEAYWSIVLCRYGIEYVEDLATHKRVPTVNRAQFTSIFDDEDYKSAIANADGYQRAIYEAEANAINEIQKGILAISQKEEPFDVFICYKETDNNGRRTRDSVLATELYHELTREGFKVFFSRITLEDKLGVAYEPYIFAALHSAKVMVVLGTRSEHFNAVWVKNEWSRFLALIKNGSKKTLIPAYRDMDPYDLPEEFSHLQAQDMSKLGFMQDLTRGIKKIVEADAPKATVKETIVATAAAINVAPLLKRAFMFLEDGDFDRADEFCEQVLNQDPENAQAYLGKLMAELRVKRQTDLANCAETFDSNKNYEKAVRFADAKLASELRGYNATTKDRNARKAEETRKEALYLKAMDDYKSYDIVRLQDAIKVFTSLAGYKDSDERIRLCQAKIDQIRIKEENDRVERERLAEQKRLEDARNAEIAQAEKIRKAQRNKKIGICLIVSIAILIACVIIAVVIYTNTEPYIYETTDNSTGITINNFRDNCPDNLIIPDYINDKPVTEIGDSAFEEMHIGREINAKSIIIPSTVTKIGHSAFRGCKDLETINIPASCTEIGAWALLDCDKLKSINFGGTMEDWESITFGQDWAPSCVYEVFVVFNGKSLSIVEVKYNIAVNLYNAGEYQKAIDVFNMLDGYEDSEEKIKECKAAITEQKYNNAVTLMNNGKYEDAITAFEEVYGYKDSTVKIVECKDNINERNYNEAVSLAKKGNYKDATIIFADLENYKDSEELWKKYSLLGCEVGDEIIFGSYEQDNNLTNGYEEIEWIVLGRNGNKIFVISKYCLEQKPFNETLAPVTWKNCTLRSWLNNTFLNMAFDNTEQQQILSSQVVDDGVTTTDKLFLLSEDEANEYFDSKYDRKATATEYVATSHCYWLLRTTGSVSNVAHVDYTGYVGYYENVDRNWWVRPAMWIDMSNIE